MVARLCASRGGSKAGYSWEVAIGYTADDLVKHLENLFLPGMTWNNYGTAWHVDHIIPVRAFNFNSVHDEDFKRCYALSNLRPLWAMENIKKGGKLKKPFQPSLSLKHHG